MLILIQLGGLEMKNNKVYNLTKASMLLAVALLFQFIKLGQFFTGTGINATLIIAASLCGPWWAASIGAITPFFAVILGVLPPAILPIVPFIILSNIIYALTFYYLKDKNEYVAIGTAALIKFLLLYTVVHYIIVKVPAPIKLAMSIPQLVTAAVGGILALIVIKIAKHLQKR